VPLNQNAQILRIAAGRHGGRHLANNYLGSFRWLAAFLLFALCCQAEAVATYRRGIIA